jgi:hypothetical protein
MYDDINQLLLILNLVDYTGRIIEKDNITLQLRSPAISTAKRPASPKSTLEKPASLTSTDSIGRSSGSKRDPKSATNIVSIKKNSLNQINPNYASLFTIKCYL